MHTPLKRAAYVVGGLVLVLVVLGLAVGWVGSNNINKRHTVATAALVVPTDAAAVARGAHLADIYGCRDCHGEDLSGQLLEDAPPFRVVASNLTPAGAGAQYTSPSHWDRAIRHGVAPDGTALVVMPSSAYHRVSDAETADLIAYLQSLAPVAKDLPTTQFKPLGRLLAAGPMDPGKKVRLDRAREQGPAPGATAEYGAYVAEGMCAYCHGPGLVGQESEAPGAPPAPDLRPAGQWPAETFHRALTTGLTPTGRQMNPQFMPWTATAKMTPDEREGLRLYIASLGDRAAN